MDGYETLKSRTPHRASACLKESRGSVRWLETVILTVAGPLANLARQASDPFFLTGAFPWFILIPLLIGLRHGLACSMVSSMLLGLGASVTWQQGALAISEFPGAYFAGLMSVSLVSSEFRSHWQRSLDRLARSEAYHRHRLEQFAKTYHILKRSHESLEQQICAGTRSMRGALSDLQKQLLAWEPDAARPFRGAGGSILKLFADYGMLQMAALWEVSGNNALHSEPVACLGIPGPVRRDDPILMAALSSRRAVALSPNQEPQGSGIMAAIPIVDISGTIHGMVTIDELPFVALQAANLKLLSVFGGYIGDCLMRWSSAAARPSEGFHAFREALQRSVLDARDCQIPATLVVLSVGTACARSEFIEQVLTSCRGLDHVWVSERGPQGFTILKLMPGTDQIGAERYIWRLDSLIKTTCGFSLSMEGLGIRIENIDGRTSADQMFDKWSKSLNPGRNGSRIFRRGTERALALGGPRWSSCSY